MDTIKAIEHEQLKNSIPDLHIGDTVRVHQRIKEGNRQRIQVFEGIVIKKQNGGLNATFTVRRIAYGVGAEKTFLINSPLVEKVEVVRIGHSRRAKLYYLRERTGKAAKTRENLRARVETKFITQKEELVVPEDEIKEEDLQENVELVHEEPVAEENAEAVETNETVEATEAPAVEETVKEEAPATEEAAPAEEKAEEATTEETTEE